jgi:ABC-type multidrug transport system fused ATPase/permease subunit
MIMNAIQLTHVTKIYQRYNRRRQFATLKSALLSGSLIRDLRPDDTFAAVRDVTFTVPAGSKTALVGETGSGKTTVGYLAARLYDVGRGSVSVAGVDLRDLTFASLAASCCSSLASTSVM